MRAVLNHATREYVNEGVRSESLIYGIRPGILELIFFHTVNSLIKHVGTRHHESCAKLTQLASIFTRMRLRNFYL